MAKTINLYGDGPVSIGKVDIRRKTKNKGVHHFEEKHIALGIVQRNLLKIFN